MHGVVVFAQNGWLHILGLSLYEILITRVRDPIALRLGRITRSMRHVHFEPALIRLAARTSRVGTAASLLVSVTGHRIHVREQGTGRITAAHLVGIAANLSGNS